MVSTTWTHIKLTLRRRSAEWIVSVALLLWGIIVTLTPGLFGQGNYINMENIAPQWIWGGGAMVVAIFRLFLLTINGWWKPSAHLRALGSLLSLLGWSAIIICYVTLPTWIPNVATIGALAVIDLTSLWYAAEDAALVDKPANETV